MKNDNFSEKKTIDLKKIEEESRAELFALKFQNTMGKLQKINKIKYLKKQIARILTIINNRKKNGENITFNVNIDYNKTYDKFEKNLNNNLNKKIEIENNIKNNK